MATAATEAVDGEEQLSDRRERVGWYFYDWANSAFVTTGVTVFLGPYLTAIAENAQDAHGRVHPFGIPVAAGSLFAYTISLSVLLQVVVLPVAGAIADRSAQKKQLLAMFAFAGSGATIAMVFLTGDRYLLGALLLLVGNLAFGASIVVYN
jgi:UMF1 family MFS transporter